MPVPKTLDLVGYVRVPMRRGVINISGVDHRFDGGGRILTVAAPMYPYASTLVTAHPKGFVDGTKLTLDLSHWSLFDHTTGCGVPVIVLDTTDPGDEFAYRLVDRYIREARSLRADDRVRWATKVAAEGDRRVTR